MRRILQSPASWAVFVFSVIFLVSYFSNTEENTTNHFRVWSLEQSTSGESDYALLRPFVTQAGTYSIALEGGRQPIFAVEIPSVSLGAASDCPLQILLLGDWDSLATCQLYQQLVTLYRDDPFASLPPLKLSLLPSRSGSTGGHFMESIIAVHFVANDGKTLSSFLSEISSGAITAQKEKIRLRLDEIEPQIASRIDPFLQFQKPLVEKSYRIAQAQLRLHEKTMQCTEATQLVSMSQIISGSPNADHIRAFLVLAKAQQDAFLSSPTGLIPLEPKRPR